MLALSVFCITGLILTGAIFFIECRIVEDLPEDNEFKKWWRKNIIGQEPKV